MMEGEILGHGAEATVRRTVFLGREAVIKSRGAKGYRHPELDKRLRTSRMKNEVRAMTEARRAGVRTPVIYSADNTECEITMEFVDGKKIKDVLDGRPPDMKELCHSIGKTIAELHNGRISHGDLTTSNMILMSDGTVCLIDLSLGSTLAEIEDLGVDIHLLQRAFTSAHSGLDGALDSILASYSENAKQADAVLKRVEDIKGRARYM
jgi:Kae1-associated kinase Bud32